MPSKVPATIDYLVNLFTAAATLGKAAPPVNVIDGPKVTADPGPLALWVGVDDITNTTGTPPAAASRQARDGLGHRAVEDLTIYCVAQAQSGSDDVRVLRVQAAAIVSAVESLVAGDSKLGGTVASATPGAAAEWRQGPTGQGMAARVTFTIDARALPEP